MFVLVEEPFVIRFLTIAVLLLDFDETDRVVVVSLFNASIDFFATIFRGSHKGFLFRRSSSSLNARPTRRAHEALSVEQPLYDELEGRLAPRRSFARALA